MTKKGILKTSAAILKREYRPRPPPQTVESYTAPTGQRHQPASYASTRWNRALSMRNRPLRAAGKSD